MKNSLHEKLFNELEALVASNDNFYRQEFELDFARYWIYNYRLASYTDFLRPGALECRGIMFEMDDLLFQNKPLRLASWPQEKFFNLNENPMTMNLDLSKIKRVEVKADGSLMSTYMHGHELRLKSKGSLFSEQAIHAMQFLKLPQNEKLHQQMILVTSAGYTINLEWCAPQHRIVIGYLEPCLTILNVRNLTTGDYAPLETLAYMSAMRERFIPTVAFDDTFISRVPDMEAIEGFVVEMESGLRFKIKTRWYLALHKTKDSVNSDRRLYEAVLAEASDDLRALFYDDPLVIIRIEKMERFVQEKYNELVKTVEEYHSANKELVRKDFAILGQKTLDKHQFRLVMAKYTGQVVDYKQYMIDHWKEYGVKDEPLLIEEAA